MNQMHDLKHDICRSVSGRRLSSCREVEPAQHFAEEQVKLSEVWLCASLLVHRPCIIGIFVILIILFSGVSPLKKKKNT
jgi:hypothetical protein